jgi:hypothetical protein
MNEVFVLESIFLFLLTTAAHVAKSSERLKRHLVIFWTLHFCLKSA